MPLYTRLSSTALIASLLAPQIAYADITVDDVWQNYRDYVSVFGSDFTATPVRDGKTLTVPDLSLQFTLPFGAGGFTVTSSGFSLTEQGDGTVTLAFPNPIIYGIAMDLTDKGSFSGNLEVSHTGALGTASGDPGDITYSYSADHMTMALRDVQAGDLDEVDVAVSAEVSDFEGTTQVAVGNLVTVGGSINSEAATFAARFKDPTGAVVNATGGSDSMSLSNTAALPRGGMDILNLAAAFRDGLSIAVRGIAYGI